MVRTFPLRFNKVTAAHKVRAAEDLWNSRNPSAVSQAYAVDCVWRNRVEFITGREAVEIFLTRKWKQELEYRLIKEIWGFRKNRIAVRFAYEWHNALGNWFRSYGNELWEFDDSGLMRRRIASINDLAITEADRKFRWPIGPRPMAWQGLTEFEL